MISLRLKYCVRACGRLAAHFRSLIKSFGRRKNAKPDGSDQHPSGCRLYDNPCSLPMLGVALGIGVIISIFQATTHNKRADAELRPENHRHFTGSAVLAAGS
jgi:hypothetical protein